MSDTETSATNAPARALVLLYPGCIEFEIMLAAELLNGKLPVTVATPEGEVHRGHNGMKVQADLPFSQVQGRDYAVVLVPGGDPGSLLGNAEISRILQEAHRAKRWIGAVCAGPFLLAQAGILKGRRIAHGYEAKQLEFLNAYFEGVTTTDDPWILDGNILTARPEAHVDFAVEIAVLGGAIARGRAESRKRYYKGAR